MVCENGEGNAIPQEDEILPEEGLQTAQTKEVQQEPSPNEFHGVVEFDLGPVYHISFGPVNVKSSFPRIKPRHERDHVSQDDLDSLQKILLEWVNTHFQTEGKESYFSELALASTLFSVYVSPMPSIYSAEMDLTIKLYFWLWFTDDELENAIENDTSFESLHQGTRLLIDVLAGEYDNGIKVYEDVGHAEFFKPLFNSLLDLHKRCGLIVPDYAARVGPMRGLLGRYFEAMRWYAVDHIDGRYSDDTFRAWRKIIAYFDGIAEVVALIEGVTLPLEIAQSSTMRRLLDIANSFGGFVNDLLGMKKEFKNGQKDNFVVFRVLCKGMPLEKVVDETCALLNAELKDFVLLKKVILKEFRNEENLVRYLDILETLIDGHNTIYPMSTRHRSAGCIKLIR